MNALPEPARQAIRGAVDAAAHAQIEASAATDWLPFSLDLALTHALARGLGATGTHRFFHDHQLAAFEGPLLKTLVMAGKDTKIASRDEFLPVCNDMPEDAQRCMNVHYTFKHMPECAQAMEKLTTEQRARYDGVMKRRS